MRDQFDFRAFGVWRDKPHRVVNNGHEVLDSGSSNNYPNCWVISKFKLNNSAALVILFKFF